MNDNGMMLLKNHNAIRMPAFPFFPWPPNTPGSSNVNPRRTHDLISLHWLCIFSSLMAELHREGIRLGMKPQ